ncbi:hypothetical protein CK489_13425 [Bradyrhizobium sp. UFLA03-84]|nr:hypothetical protein CK489_13425 [Bradyrhizobium sp. UFLA03-84]
MATSAEVIHELAKCRSIIASCFWAEIRLSRPLSNRFIDKVLFFFRQMWIATTGRIEIRTKGVQPNQHSASGAGIRKVSVDVIDQGLMVL